MGKIGGGRLVAPRIFQIQFTQTIDDQGRVGGFVDNRQKLQECLFKRSKFFILFKKFWTGLHDCLRRTEDGSSWEMVGEKYAKGRRKPPSIALSAGEENQKLFVMCGGELENAWKRLYSGDYRLIQKPYGLLSGTVGTCRNRTSFCPLRHC